LATSTQAPTAADLGEHVHLDASFEESIERVTAALKEQGFGVLTTIHVHDTLKARIGVEFRKYAILGACNPTLAHKALSTDLGMGLLLPCNVVVYEDAAGGGSVVSLVDPISMMGVVQNPALQAVADEAASRLHAVAEALERN
jgi:uncharacterized protein (DUF302 family)